MADRMIGEGTDFQKNQLKNPAIHALGTAPSSPVEGQLYYDTATKKLYYRNDTTWIDCTGGAVTFGTVVSELTYGISAANGANATASRSDHTHGTPSLSANVASTQAIGDTATNGTGTAPAKDDHKHAMPTFATPSGALTFGGSNAAGSAVTLPRADHVHALPAHDAAAHSAISISSLAAATGTLNLGAQLAQSSAVPSGANDLTNKTYVDSLANGVDWKASVRAATTANITTLAGGAPNTLDGVTLAATDRILVKDQSTGSQNGIYTVTTLGTGANGTWTRATDADVSAEVTSGLAVLVTEGTANGDTGWTLTTNDPITLATTALVFTQFTSLGQITAGAGLTKTGASLDVGAGTGITVNADDVAINTAVVVRKYAVDFGNASLSSFTITHNLGTLDVTVECFANSGGVKWEFGIVHATTNTITITTGAMVPTSNQFRCVVHG